MSWCDIAVIAIFVLTLLLIAYACCALSSRISRWEERAEDQKKGNLP